MRFLSAGRRGLAVAASTAVVGSVALIPFSTDPSSASSIGPSGVAMPTVAPAGYSQSLADDFLGTKLNTDNWWGAYAGEPGGDASGYWDPSQVSVSGGALKINSTYEANAAPDGAHWVSGGVSGKVAQTYGEYEVRMRGDAGQGISDIALLWPTKGWPPEIDFYEDDPAGANRTGTASTIHWDSANYKWQLTDSSIDGTQWHTWAIVWSPGKIVYYVDGSIYGSLTESQLAGYGAPDATDAISAQPMVLDLQSQALGNAPAATVGSTVEMEVDWVVAYTAD